MSVLRTHYLRFVERRRRARARACVFATLLGDARDDLPGLCGVADRTTRVPRAGAMVGYDVAMKRTLTLLTLALVGTACASSSRDVLTPSPTRTALPTFTPMPTFSPMPSATLASQPTVDLTRAVATRPPTVTAVPTRSAWRVVDPTQIYGGPGTNYVAVGELARDTEIVVAARSVDRVWLYITSPHPGWIPTGLVEVDVLGGLTFFTPPPPPVSTATAVAIPSFMGGNVPVQVETVVQIQTVVVVVTATPAPAAPPTATLTRPPSPTMPASPPPPPSPTAPPTATRPPTPSATP